MVSLVLVSHSLDLATSLVTLIQSMVKSTVQIAVAAGVDDPEHPWGTDVIKIQQAIESVYTDDGVLVFMDLGSAVLSAEMAVEFLDTEQQNNIKLSDSPLVEGAIAAAIMASTGASFEEVIREAQQSLTPKLSQLANQQVDSHYQLDKPSLDTALTTIVQVNCQDGLHLRPAAQLVTKVKDFSATIRIRKANNFSNFVEGNSINQLMLLGVKQGEEIEIEARGKDAKVALKALQEVITQDWQENNASTPSPISPVKSANANELIGIPASPGIVIAPCHFYESKLPEVTQQFSNDSEFEWEKFQKTRENSKQQIESLAKNEDIFQAHLLYLDDPQLQTQTKELIYEQQYTAAFAWKIVIESAISDYQNLETEYLQARIIDLQDIGNRVLKSLLGIEITAVNIESPHIIITAQLIPSQVAQFNPQQVLGIATAFGSATDHSAIIANLLGIPMVVGLGDALLELAPHTRLKLDGTTGVIEINSSSPTTTVKPPLPSPISSQPAVTGDGQEISLVANIIGIADAQLAMNYGACGVGLLRTEFLYLDRQSAPTETEQFNFYQACASVIAPYPLTIRTADIGGDKLVSYLNNYQETNPFLGRRGIRLSLAQPDLFKTQLKAILRVSAEFNLRLMLPMVSCLREVQLTKVIIKEVQEELQQNNIPFNDKLPLGIMVEVPAAVIMADQLASEVDFFSIGTNDLAQYIMAADRTNPDVVDLTMGLPPALLRVIEQTVKVAHEYGITVSVCGQLASIPEAIPTLLALEVDQLSVNPPMIPQVREIVSQYRL